MKKIEGNLVYNTETAAKVAEWTNGYGWSDFNYRCKELHRTNKGNWFLYDFTYNVNNSNCIEGISPVEARDFLCEISAINEIEEHFPGSLEEA